MPVKAPPAGEIKKSIVAKKKRKEEDDQEDEKYEKDFIVEDEAESSGEESDEEWVPSKEDEDEDEDEEESDDDDEDETEETEVEEEETDGEEGEEDEDEESESEGEEDEDASIFSDEIDRGEGRREEKPVDKKIVKRKRKVPTENALLKEGKLPDGLDVSNIVEGKRARRSTGKRLIEELLEDEENKTMFLEDVPPDEMHALQESDYSTEDEDEEDEDEEGEEDEEEQGEEEQK